MALLPRLVAPRPAATQTEGQLAGVDVQDTAGEPPWHLSGRAVDVLDEQRVMHDHVVPSDSLRHDRALGEVARYRDVEQVGEASRTRRRRRQDRAVAEQRS